MGIIVDLYLVIFCARLENFMTSLSTNFSWKPLSHTIQFDSPTPPHPPPLDYLPNYQVSSSHLLKKFMPLLPRERMYTRLLLSWPFCYCGLNCAVVAIEPHWHRRNVCCCHRCLFIIHQLWLCSMLSSYQAKSLFGAWLVSWHGRLFKEEEP